MRVLVACEESQIVCKAFREKGYEAFSCDLQECSGDRPEWHIKGDALEIIRAGVWDTVISFPPCTHIACSGTGHFKSKRLSGEQEAAITFFLDIWEISHAVENPKNIMSGWIYLKKWFPSIIERMLDIGFPKRHTQRIHPYQFGHGETKETWLWLKGLPKLKPTNIVKGRENRIWRMAPSKDRGKLRSKTYEGIAMAMADQWSKKIPFNKQHKQLSLL